jgi:hypothetical protein
MKIINNLINLFILLFSFLSCTSKVIPDSKKINFPKTINLNLSEATTDTLNLSEISDKVEYIPLQTTDSLLMEYFYDFVVTKNYYFVHNGLEIMRFNKSGRFINSLFKVGRGPGEALPVCFTVNEEEKLVYVFDRNKYVKIYDYNGTVINTIKKPINPPEALPPWAIGYFNNNLFVSIAQRPGIKYIYSCYNLVNDSVRILYKNYNTYDKSQEGKWPAVIPYDYNFQITDSTIMFKERYCDTVFTVNKDFIIEPRYIIDIGEKKLEWKDWRDHGMFGFASGLPYGYWVNSFIETKNYLFIVLNSYKAPELFVVYNKTTDLNKIYTRKVYKRAYDQIFIKNNLDNLMLFAPMNQSGYLFYYDGCLYSILESKDFAEAYKSASKEIKNSTKYLKEMAPVISSITEFSNPVIMKVYLK